MCVQYTVHTYTAAYRKCGLGGTLSFQNVGGGKGVYDVLTLQKSRGDKSSPRGGGGGQRPTHPPKRSPAVPGVVVTFHVRLAPAVHGPVS